MVSITIHYKVSVHRNPVQQSSQPLSDKSSCDTSLGIESLAFHDHHLSRRGSHKVMKTLVTVGNSSFQQMSALELLAVTESASQLPKEKHVHKSSEFISESEERNK